VRVSIERALIDNGIEIDDKRKAIVIHLTDWMDDWIGDHGLLLELPGKQNGNYLVDRLDALYE
jgi:hypothetical protein